MADAQSGHWLNAYAALAAISDPAWRRIARAARHQRFPAGGRIYRDGEPCRYYLLVIEGSVQVQKTTGDGHEIVLYHVNPGQTCGLTTACMLGGGKCAADAVAVTPVHAVLISREQFTEVVLNSADFRNFVYTSLDRGIAELIALIESVAFVHVDRRIARQLLEYRDVDHLVHATHQEIARELGTAREVVSRMLKHFEHMGWVRLHRGWIELVDERALRALAGPPV